MSNTWKRIHLGVNAERASTASPGIFGDPCGLEEMVAGNLEAMLLDEVGENVVSVAGKDHEDEVWS